MRKIALGKGLKRYLPFIIKALGLCLICGAAFVGYFLYYRYAPAIRLANPKWCDAHSAKARWEEEQKKYRRDPTASPPWGGGGEIGYCGDKQWCLWLIEKLHGKKGVGGCKCMDLPLKYMTNHEPSEEADAWTNWREAHQAETQEEWIQSGFAKRGVIVHLPPEPEDTLPLLEVLGHQTWNALSGTPEGTNAQKRIPGYFQYNAFRWLRDSGFNPSEFSASNSVAFTSEVVRAGLINYTAWFSAFPRRNDVGILAFGEKPDERYLPAFMDPSCFAFWFYRFLLGFPVVGVVAGVVLLRWKRKKQYGSLL